MRVYTFSYSIAARDEDDARERLAELIADEGFQAPVDSVSEEFEDES